MPEGTLAQETWNYNKHKTNQWTTTDKKITEVKIQL